MDQRRIGPGLLGECSKDLYCSPIFFTSYLSFFFNLYRFFRLWVPCILACPHVIILSTFSEHVFLIHLDFGYILCRFVIFWTEIILTPCYWFTLSFQTIQLQLKMHNGDLIITECFLRTCAWPLSVISFSPLCYTGSQRFVCFFFPQHWRLNPGPHTRLAGILPLNCRPWKSRTYSLCLRETGKKRKVILNKWAIRGHGSVVQKSWGTRKCT